MVELGPSATRFAVGDRVMGIVGGGGQAELCTVHERILMPVPERLSWTEAGGAPEVFTTAQDAVFTQGRLLAGERLLVHGGAGGVGTAAIQLGHVAGARVTATVRNPEPRERVAQFGATVIEPDGFAEHGPFDLILELVGAINLADNIKSIEFNGRISVIGTSAGAVGELNLGLLMHKRARIYGSTLRARPLEQKAMTARAVERSVLPALGSGDDHRADRRDVRARGRGRRLRPLCGRRQARQDRARHRTDRRFGCRRRLEGAPARNSANARWHVLSWLS